MKLPTRHWSRIIMLALAAGIASIAYVTTATSPVKTKEDAPKAEATKPLSPKVALLTLGEDDLLIGDPDALVTIIEYSSMSCSHCADFHNDVLPKLRTEYIDKGKVNLSNRDYPLNEPALRASMLVRCAEDRGEKFQDVLFKMQSSWAFTPSFSDELRRIAAVGGISSESFDACMADKTLEERILKSRQQGADILKIEATPSFFINGVAMTDPPTYENIKKRIDYALKHSE